MKAVHTHHNSVFCFIFAAICLLAFSQAVAAHTPSFTWQVRNGVVFPEQWIYDGDIPIARFDNRTVDQPGLQLMFFNSVPKPVVLRDVKLTPDGQPMADCIQLYCKCGPTVTDRLTDLQVDGEGTERLVVTFITEDRFKVLRSRRVMTLTYDNERETYMYDFSGDLTFNSPESFNGGTVSFEFTDPWWIGCPGPAVSFQGMWEKRYQQFIYESQNQGVLSMPINHYTTSHKGGIRLKPDGLFVTAYEPDGNPAIQFVGETADRSSISICWWGYDYHLSRHVTPDELFAPVPVHFRIFQCPDSRVKQLMSEATPRPLGADEWNGYTEYPVYERNSSFANSLRIDEHYDGGTDPFPWTYSGDGAVWDTTSGRADSYSMKITRESPGLTRWQTFQGDGAGYFTGPWTPCKGYRVSCYVKTEALSGRGATLGVQYHIPNSQQQYPVVTADRISGTTGWTRLSVEIGPPGDEPPEVGCLMIMLQQDGAGTSWFDDLRVEPIGGN